LKIAYADAATSGLLLNNTSRSGWLRLAEIGFGTKISGSLRGNMLRQFFVGGGVSLINIAIHALVMTTVVRVAQAANAKVKSQTSLLLMAVPTVSVLRSDRLVPGLVLPNAALMTKFRKTTPQHVT
jgi:hypothetical protein